MRSIMITGWIPLPLHRDEPSITLRPYPLIWIQIGYCGWYLDPIRAR